ncbi:MAG TPA: hypothetical protein VMT00_09850 [Thermoanaerobaculia bacterium]|nr:hypothetical protein [Thermoanaerobaculia bacterium]
MQTFDSPPGSAGPRLERVTLVAIVAVALVIAAVFFARFAPARVALLRIIPPLATAVLVAGASVSVGRGGLWLARRMVQRWVGVEGGEEPRLEEVLLVGVPLLGTGMSVLALAGLLHPPLILIVALVLAFASARWSARALVSRLSGLEARTLLLLAPPLAVAILGAITPVASPDELVYKLAIPRTYQLFGGMIELPLNSISYAVSALYMADLAALILSGGIAAKLLHLLVFFATLAVLSSSASRIDPRARAWVVVVIAWTPALMIIAGWAWAEWGMIGLLMLSVLAWDRYFERPSSTDVGIASLALAMALASKYTALPWLVVFVPLAWMRLRRVPGRGNAVLASAAVIVALAGGFFYVRNFIWTGSPVAPFMLPDSPSIENYRSTMGGLRELISGYDIVHPAIIDDSLGILLPIMVLISPFALAWRSRFAADLFIIGIGQMVILVAIAPTSRLILLGLAPLSVLGSVVAVRTWMWTGRFFRSLITLGAGTALAGQLVLVGLVLSTYEMGPYLTGTESEAEYVARTRRFARPFTWIEQNTPPDSVVLFLGENRPYYLRRRALAGANLDGPRIARFLARFPTADELRKGLQQEGITHVLVNKQWYRIDSETAPEPSMLEKEYLLIVSPATDRVLRSFLGSDALLRYSDETYLVYELP